MMLDRSVLKENQTFLVTAPDGDIVAGNTDGQGLYFQDTRFLSLYELRVQGTRPRLLSALGEYDFMSTLQFANDLIQLPDGRAIAPRTISIRRNRLLRGGLHERIGFFSYNQYPLELLIDLVMGSDFRDMFDIRGYARPTTRGQLLVPEIDGRVIRLRYIGLDEVERETVVTSEVEPSDVELLVREAQVLNPEELPGIGGHGDVRVEKRIRPPTVAARFAITVLPHQPYSLTVHVQPHIRTIQIHPSSVDLDAAFIEMERTYRDWEESATAIETDHEMVNAVIRRARHDLRLLMDDLPTGLLPSAGIPWFSVPFGRDSLITSIQTLMLRPDVAYGTLRFLAQHQGKQIDDWRDEEPGKILHEVRLGELAALGQVPHTPYYGSVDSTPLFLVTLGQLLDWTDDWEFARAMEPHVDAALEWIDRYGDLDGDGLVEYRTRSPKGIHNQGWKDSHDSITHRSGQAASLPIALSEVQGYVYDAKIRMSRFFDRLGKPDRAEKLRREAQALRRLFDDQFWLERERFYALALDGEKRPVESISSNPGQCLGSDIVLPERLRPTVERLLSEEMLSGWGVRTLSWNEPSYNPMSYHNGSVWPHDNALIAAGARRQRQDKAALRIISQVMEAAMRMPQYRLPELYCGFGRDRRYYSMPAPYPVSCSPQAWAAGSVFLMVQSLLGVEPRLEQQELRLRPILPSMLNELTVRNMRVGKTSVDLRVFQDGDATRVEVLRSGGLKIVADDGPRSILA